MIIAALLFSVSALAETPGDDPLAWKDLGFSVASQAELGGGFSTIAVNAKANLRLIYTYSALGRLERIEERTIGGGLRKTRTFLLGVDTTIEYAPDGTAARKRVVSHGARDGWIRVEETKAGETTVEELLSSQANACNVERTSANAAQLNALIGGITVASGAISSDGSAELASHASARGCSGYPGGVAAMRTDFSEALKIGGRCLSDLAARTGRTGPLADAATLVQFASNGNSPAAPAFGTRSPLTFFCGATGAVVDHVKIPNALGQQLDCHDTSAWPAIAINSAAAAGTSVPERRSTIFHEMLHMLGYKHTSTNDVPYLAESCCFGIPANFPKPDACTLLGETYNTAYGTNAQDYWKSNFGLSGYADLMQTQSRSSIAYRTGLKAGGSDVAGQAFKATLVATGLQKSYAKRRQGGDPAFGAGVLTMATMSLMNSEGQLALSGDVQKLQSQLPASGPKRELASAVSNLLHFALQGNKGPAMANAIKQLSAARKSGCAALTPAEKRSLMEMTDGTRFAVWTGVEGVNVDGHVMTAQDSRQTSETWGDNLCN